MGLASGCTIVDITHEIPPGDILRGALVLREACRFFPPSSVHLAVVDPGVGTHRKPIAARAGGMFFVGPDNGLLSMALDIYDEKEVRAIEKDSLFLVPTSSTFHGRDVFAPVAAFLANGGEIQSLGHRLNEWERIEVPKVRREKGALEGLVVYVDRFGNGITNISRGEIEKLGKGKSLKVNVQGVASALDVKTTYGEVPPGSPLALVGSSGFLEIAVNSGNASRLLGLEPGRTTVRVSS